jgi:lipopolysaccharide export system protein LptA
LKPNITYKHFFFFIIFGAYSLLAKAQVVLQPQAPDTLRIIQILQGNSLREKLIDSATSLQTLAGAVMMREGSTTFTCDSATINKRTNIMEAFGNIHINQSDSIHTYAQYLRYVGADRVAFLKKDVRLTDKKGTLYTQELEYDLKTNIGKYKGGGRVVNGKTILTSNEGVYYGDTKDVFFKKNVLLKDPKYDIRSDSLQYNTQTQMATFITGTYIKSKNGGEIYTTAGNYDLKKGKAFFGNRSVIKDSTRTYVADNIAMEEANGIAQLEGNAVIRDSANGYTIMGNQIFANKKDQSFLATRKPILIFVGEKNDSTFIAADTLFSGVIKLDNNEKKIELQTDTLKKEMVVSAETVSDNKDSARIFEEMLLPTTTKDSTFEKPLNTLSGNGLLKRPMEKDSAQPQNLEPLQNVKDSSTAQDSISFVNSTSATTKKANATASEIIRKDTAINLAKDTAIRYFQAFHKVRIFNDSLQAVCDSLFYSSEDSVFRLFQNPLVFSRKTQIAGDTIHLFTKNKKASRVYVFENGIIINELNKQMYNQVGGRTMNGYFKEGAIEYMRVKGSPAESIFYPQDDDSAYTGMNKCHGDLIDVYFIDKAVNKIKFINEVDGILYPLRQIPAEEKYLKKFKWLDSRRPKNKLELFE